MYTFPALSATLTVCEVVDILTKAMIRLPAVFALENAAATDPVAVPSIEFAWINAIEEPPAPMVIDNAFEAVCETASVTFAEKLNVPAVFGVPDITPLEALRDSPPGNAPDKRDHV